MNQSDRDRERLGEGGEGREKGGGGERGGESERE